jgi:sirohydrochlorin cobaltochelatase
MNEKRLVLLAHGSKDPRWRSTFERFADSIKAEMGESALRLAYMEFAPPTLGDVVEESTAQGISSLRILPLFMAGGAHLDRDVPAQVREVELRFPGLDIEVLEPIGEDPRFFAVMRDIVKEAVKQA